MSYGVWSLVVSKVHMVLNLNSSLCLEALNKSKCIAGFRD